MNKLYIQPGALEAIARSVGASSDSELAAFLGVEPQKIEEMRYQGVTLMEAAEILKKKEAHEKAAALFAA
ncbi:hypothetical protein [Corynebacterium ulcerans]|uniref:hypothetical protein n=1 Tax=Corynebacterium ulcerans TaxID=65058 RepID=UPI0013C77522|nr:hypothetical protein [Corynebacterium ulcerans]NON15648.1 hypothetical protein [Corynebacterium ulcerans]CAB0973609.1 hypothetical protein FRC0482_01523 [Corynebacterium diphtheriae]